MPRVIVPDSGPLFSLAAGNLLPHLLHFEIHVTDVVRSETIEKGRGANPSSEARDLLDFHNRNSSKIKTVVTQPGADRDSGRIDGEARNLGEMSIQSYLMATSPGPGGEVPIVIFEDSWFLHNEPSIYKHCLLLSTFDFLGLLETMGQITSAEEAFDSIFSARPLSAATVTEYVAPKGSSPHSG